MPAVEVEEKGSGGCDPKRMWQQDRNPSVNPQRFGARLNVFKIFKNGLDRGGAFDFNRL